MADQEIQVGALVGYCIANHCIVHIGYCIANHQYKLYIKPARLNCYKNSFFIRIVKLWNELPGDIVEADSFQHFKSKLKSYLNI